MKKYTYPFVLFVLFGAAILFFAQNTYSKYMENVTGTTSIQIAKWDIKLNNQSINSDGSLAQNIEPVFPGNDLVNEGVIAPGAKGYYDLIIDATNVDVAFEYNLSIKVADEAVVKDIAITGYKYNPVDKNDFEDKQDLFIVGNGNSTQFDGEFLLSQKILTIRIYVEWIESNSMDDDEDTSTVINNSSTALINNKIQFRQITQ